ncbi:hypothetical protein GQ53DRAFT_338430 [Thozetella sp. PMI_491]|nr:hypothetical protein GQ53DRAFT_338430 [Thozetella sp. PMI_491]
MDAPRTPSQSSSMEVNVGSQTSSVIDGQRQDATKPSTLVTRSSPEHSSREEITSDFIKVIQDELRKKEAHTREPQFAVHAYMFAAVQKVHDAIGGHTELVPHSGSPAADPSFDLRLYVEEAGGPGFYQHGSGTTAAEDGGASSTSDEGLASGAASSRGNEPGTAP